MRSRLRILTQHLYQTSFAAEIDDARGIAHSGVPVEMLVHQTLALEIVGEGTGVGVIYRQTVLGGDPQTAIGILNEALDTRESQAVGGGQGFEVPTGVAFVLHQTIQAVAIAAQPQRTIVGLAEG